MDQSSYVITFWRYPDENQMPIYVLTVTAIAASDALWRATEHFVKQGLSSDIDHVTIRKA